MSAPSWIKGLLAFERDGDVFCIREPEPNTIERLFGGLIAAQSLGAAGATVDDDKVPQSLHAYFVRGGRYDTDVEFRVTRIRDGRAFATRQVSASQDGKVILEMIASFHAPEPGVDWQPRTEPRLEFDAAVPKDPEIDFSDAFEVRTRTSDDSEFAVPPFWIRTREPVEDDPLVRACALTYMSDLGPVPTRPAPDGSAAARSGVRDEPRPLDLVPPPVPAGHLAPLRVASGQPQRLPRPHHGLADRRIGHADRQCVPGGAVAP